MREPLTIRSLAAGIVAAVANLAIVLGADLPSGLQSAIVGVVAAGALVWAVIQGRREVTPVATPKANDGTALVKRTE